jgi:hypothetical protein
MTADEFASYARSHAAKSLRLDDIIVVAGKDSFHMNGSLRVVNDVFQLDLIQREAPRHQQQSIWTLLRELIQRIIGKRPNQSGDLPHVGGFVGASQFWEVSGLIENKLPFRCRTIPTSHTLALGDISTKGARFEVGRLLVGAPQLAHEHTAALLKKISGARKDIARNSQESVDVTTKECEPPSSDVVYEFTALIPSVKPLWSDQITTVVKTNVYLGETTRWKRDTIRGFATDVEFSLIRRKPDMEVRMRYREGVSVTETTARDRFSSLLAAVAFTHGCEPWYQRHQIRRGIQQIEDTVTARQSVPQTTYSAMSSRLASSGADLPQAIILAMDFFSTATKTAERIKTLLHIARQAGAEHVAFDLGITGLCAVFEGVIDALYEEADLSTSLIAGSDDLKAFAKARKDLLEELVSKAEKDPGYKRVRSIIQSAKLVRGVEKAAAVASHLGLDWEKILKPAFDAWWKERNPSAHGSFSEEDDEDVLRDRMFNKSRIAGGINLLIQKRMGYRGLAIRSILEEEFVRLT